MEREVVAAVQRHPEGAVVTVAGASAHMAGAVMAAGEEQWRQSRGAFSKEKKMKDGAARVHGAPLAWESKMVKQMGMKMSGDIIDSMDGW